MAITLNVDVDGVDRLLGRLEAAPAVMEAANTEAMTKSVFFLESAVKAGTPRVTGRLFSSIHGHVHPGAGSLRGTVGTSVSYAPMVESGRGAVVAQHLTKSGKPGYLRFRGRDGRWVYRRAVGPARGRHMFAAGLAASIPAIREFFHDAAKRVAESIRGV